MGLLDDAIRQHLDLKRRHGADPSDVAKLEHEAFGPIERAEALEAADAPEGLHGTAQEEELAYAEAEHEADEEWAAGHESVPPPEPVGAPEPAPTAGGSVRLDDPGEQTVEFSALSEDDPAPEPQPDAAAPGEHDELEETPEFLQETPEHDRLWFEQKPPRDFDF